jgi:UDP-2,4-diacetamido-2,4,6-trideoxy-beta-L-altropyranose hydrolase
VKRLRVVIRADAAPAVGMGHVVRCLALAHELSELGAEVHLASKSLPPVLEQNARQLGLGVSMLGHGSDAEATLEILRRLSEVDIVIVDHYGLDEAWERAIRPLAARLMVLEDLASRVHLCDVLLDQNYSAAGADRYRGLVPPGASVLLGPAYALIRREFRVARLQRCRQSDAIRTILVSFGGFDSPRLVQLVMQACVQPPLSSYFAGGTLHVFGARQHSGVGDKYPFEVCEHRFSSDIATFMAESDIAIGAGGGGSWERLCVGVPSLVTILAENQRPGVEALAKDGYIVNLGDVERLDASSLCQAVCNLRADPGALRRMSEHGRKLVDGEGVQRVARVLLQ